MILPFTTDLHTKHQRKIMRIFHYGLVAVLLAVSISINAADRKYVSVDVANIRNAPNGPVIDRMHRGSEVEVHLEANNWSRISSEDATPRWIYSSLLCSTPSCSISAPPSKSNRNLGRSHRQSLSAKSKSFKRSRTNSNNTSFCPCSGGQVCIGPRGGRYCITSGGNKRYGV